MRWRICFMSVMLALCGWAAEVKPTYTLGTPAVPTICNVTNVADSSDWTLWASSNALIAPVALVYVKTNEVVASSTADDADLTAEGWHAESIAGGFPIEQGAPQYYLGDQLDAPADVDWDATYAVFETLEDRGNFLFDTGNRRVYVVLGETSKFKWVTKQANVVTTSEVAVVAVPMSMGRPKNIFWTDKAYGGSPVDLSGKFVKLFGPSNLLTCVYGKEDTGVNMGDTPSYRTIVTSGVYVDDQSTSKMLYAAGTLEGQFVLAYYDSGNYERLVDVITVRVSCPVKNIRTATIGSAITPDGGGYDGTGLVASPNETDEPNDGLGAYLYQHNGTYAYSPKNKDVFALRPTNDQTRNRTLTTWYETDNQAVRWPFEMDEYLVDWPTDMSVIVRGESSDAPGRGVRIPDVYTAELQKYQEDEGKDPMVSSHARAPADGYFTPVGAGRSLLKLTANDNIWFVPFRSVLRTDTEWYNLGNPPSIPVGQEMVFRGGNVSGLAASRTLDIAADIPGYIYEPQSDPVWNPEIYSDSGILANGVTSSVYAVTADMTGASNEVEVWWSTRYAQADMPSALEIPALPQRWSVVWPGESQAPTITLASQLGGGGVSFWGQGQALVFGEATTQVPLPTRAFFGETGGAILFWTRDLSATSAQKAAERSATCSLLTLGDTNGVPVITIDYVANQGFRTVFDDVTLQTKPIADTSAWHLYHLTWDATTVSCSIYSDQNWGALIECVEKSNDSARTAKLSACLSANTLGAVSAARSTWQYREMDQVYFFRRPVNSGAAHIYEMTNLLGTDDTNISLAYTFNDLDELVSDGSVSDYRRIREQKLKIDYYVSGCLSDSPGAPAYDRCILQSDTTPIIYRQTDMSACGFNPNEEHAFIEAGQEGYVVWALRSDLNQKIRGYEPVSRPGVLVSYTRNGKAKMCYYHVAVTNFIYDVFGDTCTVGAQLPGPHPFDLMETPWLPETTWTDPTAEPPFRDRKGQVWARAPGEFDILMYYEQQSDFDWPEGLDTPSLGAAVPWLAYADTVNPTDVLTKPKPWHWNVRWPTTDVPTMRIGYTLTTAAYDLPEVWNATSMALLYPVTNASSIALLSDPTVARRVPLGFKASTQLAEAGLKTGSGEKLLDKKGMYYFRDITATLSNRLYIDPTTDELVLIGEKESKTAGVNLLFPNVMSTNELQSVKNLLTTEGTVTDQLVAALETMAQLKPVEPTTVTPGLSSRGYVEYVDTYEAPDHYALTAMGTGAYGATNWVVLIENNATNAFCDAGNPINMHLIKIVPEYYTGDVVTREDPNNLLSQILSIHYSQNFCGQADDFEFEWQRAAPSTMDWRTGRQAYGLTSFSVGEQGDTLANMVNTYWRCRYRAVRGAAYVAMGDAWSDWSDKGLAEGWVQRCLNNVTPFTQRMTDLYNNAAETSVTMIRQAGKPYEGDVALNQDNLTSVGLIQLYRTILNKAETMSLMQGLNDAEANKQLLLAAERLADLYNVLGDEAYADAINPTIGFGSNFAEIEPGLAIDYGAASSSLFCFDNQVSSLLDEELALVRGRDCLDDPDGHTSPYFNRLVWNVTKGITAGEVAYAVNYGISGNRSSTITAETAAEQYPQGHGDAFGHYLSALKGYYRLLRNPYFSWGDPAMGEMNVADSVVNVDYYDESTFATSAANVAKAADKAVELTAIKAWRDNNSETVGAGYLDANTMNAFGYGEWASRGAYGAFCNWAVANSLLPEAKATDDDGVLYADKGLTRIDRSTVPGIATLSETVEDIQLTCDRMDAGKNPLGLDANAVPFDLTPIGDADDATHFEQIRARAGQAFDNARDVLDRAQTYANRLKLIQETEAGIIDNLDAAEDDFNVELIAIYGRPYEKDIGAAGTYAQGYYGPDTYHYMWMDLAEYGLTEVEDTMAVTTVVVQVSGSTTTTNADGEVSVVNYSSDAVSGSAVNTVSYALSANGVVVKPDSITGDRPASGSLQIAYADFLTAYARVQQKRQLYVNAAEARMREMALLTAQQTALAKYSSEYSTKKNSLDGYYTELRRCKQSKAYMDQLMKQLEVGTKGDVSYVGAIGMATTVCSDTAKSVARVFTVLGEVAGLIGSLAAETAQYGYECSISKTTLSLEAEGVTYAYTSDEVSMWERLTDAITAETAANDELNEALVALNAAQEPISKRLQDARGIEETRELTRQQYVNNIAKLRYNDMFFRKMRNAALTQYDTAFALAQKYTLLAAKAYAYETGSPLESTEEGRALLRAIVGARALGEVDNDGKPMVSESGDAGLSGILAKLDANWANRKTQLGINNPQPYATWFSLRHGLFRILPDTLGDDAWAKELTKYWVEDIRSDAEFVRYCQPFSSQFGLAEKEPGLVIPFETTIDFAYNLFGLPLAFDDAQFDSSWYATKISKAGVWFEGYNQKRTGYMGASAFATTPNVYLVPVGTDRMRVPGTDANDEIVDFDVVDQTIPAPYPLTAAEIAQANWMPTYSGETAGADAESRLRRHPSFRAYYGDRGVTPSDTALDATRLVGRSVWNTRWLLVIPAGALNADRDQALKSFIYGLDTDRDGVIDVQPVSDIKIGFKTYSIGGL